MVQKTGTKRGGEAGDETAMPVLPRNVYLRSNGYQYRIVVPSDLRPLIGKTEIKVSLGKDRREAISRSRVLALDTDQRFRTARAMLAEKSDTHTDLDQYLKTPASQRKLKVIDHVTKELSHGLQALWLTGLENDLARRRDGICDEEYDELETNIAQMKRKINRALATGQVEPFKPFLDMLVHGRGYELALCERDERALLIDVLQAVQAGYDLLEERQQGRLVEPELESSSVLPAVWEQPSSPPGFGWSELFTYWQKDRQRPISTDRAAQSALDSLIMHVPKSTTPATLTRAQVTAWLRELRENRGNSVKTLEKKGTLVGALFSVAVKDECVEKNPLAGFDYSRFAAKIGIEKSPARQPFTTDQLRKIFSPTAGVYSVEGKAGGGYYARVWFPLIGLLTGARLDEIGSLTVNDVAADPHWHLSLRVAKNQSSIRKVPIHPKLVDLGFITYVEAVRAAGHNTLWPELKSRSSKSKNSEVLGRWFNRYIHTELALPKTVVFHSFRHTFKDLCRNSLIPSDIHHVLTGHSRGATGNVGDSYGNGPGVEVLYEQISRIQLQVKLPRPEIYPG